MRGVRYLACTTVRIEVASTGQRGHQANRVLDADQQLPQPHGESHHVPALMGLQVDAYDALAAAVHEPAPSEAMHAATDRLLLVISDADATTDLGKLARNAQAIRTRTSSPSTSTNESEGVKSRAVKRMRYAVSNRIGNRTAIAPHSTSVPVTLVRRSAPVLRGRESSPPPRTGPSPLALPADDESHRHRENDSRDPQAEDEGAHRATILEGRAPGVTTRRSPRPLPPLGNKGRHRRLARFGGGVTARVPVRLSL